MDWKLTANILFILLMAMGLVALVFEHRREQWKEYAKRMRRERDVWEKRYRQLQYSSLSERRSGD